MRKALWLGLALALAGCATPPRGAAAPGTPAPRAIAPVPVRIIAFNDFHGALEPPRMAVPEVVNGQAVRVPAGGAAYFASAVRALREGHPNNVTVSAGDLISASPLTSAAFLDEPTILAMNLIGLDFNAVGNHEFDRGRRELLRMQNGGCAVYTNRVPCLLDPDFPGASFRFLAANVRAGEGDTIFPSYGLRRFGEGDAQVTIGFIGLTTRDTATLVTPDGVAGLSFEDEANSINALVPRLRAEGADAIVVVIHQGVETDVPYDDRSCRGMRGDLMAILARLDPAIDVVVSGHTHNAYICNYGEVDPARPFLVTSAGRSGTLVTAIDLSIDPAAGRVSAKTADFSIVQGEAYRGSGGQVALTDAFPRFQPDPAVSALVARYVAAAAPMANRVVGRLSGPASREKAESGESVLGNLIADAHLAATRAPEAGGAQIAFTNQTSVRADIVPAADGSVTFGQLFTAQPFGNNLVIKSFSGRELRAILEQQWASGTNTVTAPIMLLPSRGLTYGYDLARPVGQRVLDLRLNGQPVGDETVYRIAFNSFLASGGDNFTLFRGGRDMVGGPLDLDAIERYLAAGSPLTPPAADRIRRLSPR
ncbi:MAG TPA: 5'-nucleotidase C-terminal domain-containing protein [Allosphingosinicella sp.]|nr:5'-nucleotidase C-terminal domain-containing protein [Allosphingosinicella sp.]